MTPDTARGLPELDVAHLVHALQAIDRLAVDTQRKLAGGLAVNGHTGLCRIHELADSALADLERDDQ